MTSRVPVRHQHNKKLLGFVYYEKVEEKTWGTAIDDGQKLHTGLRIQERSFPVGALQEVFWLWMSSFVYG